MARASGSLTPYGGTQSNATFQPSIARFTPRRAQWRTSQGCRCSHDRTDDSDCANIDEVSDAAPASSQALREAGAQMLRAMSHRAELISRVTRRISLRQCQQCQQALLGRGDQEVPLNTSGSAEQVCAFDCGRWSSSKSEVSSGWCSGGRCNRFGHRDSGDSLTEGGPQR